MILITPVRSAYFFPSLICYDKLLFYHALAVVAAAYVFVVVVTVSVDVIEKS
jgi:hypothetical protein